MYLSVKKRLGILVSAIWMLVLLGLYLIDPYKTYRDIVGGFLLFGIGPVTGVWLVWWVWDGFRQHQKGAP